jgi:hypothetical protein
MALTQQCRELDDASGRSRAAGELFLCQPSLSALHQRENDDTHARSFSHERRFGHRSGEAPRLVERGLLPTAMLYT